MHSESHRYLPGVDGLRAVSVLLVLVFHSGLGWLPGGFVGVSVFFTLSGYLITGLLLRELNQTNTISLRRFWTRRIRRLAPAALVCIAAVCLWALASSAATQGPNLRRDSLSALANVANWRFAFGKTSYADLFSGPSPLLHMWSLAIEEQFYFVFPVVVVALWRCGLRRRGLAVTFAIAAVASGVAAVVTASDPLAYYGTHTRAVELLVGGVLALTSAGRLEAANSRRARRVTTFAGVVAATVIVGVARFGSATSDTLIHGGLALVSIASVALVSACIVTGPTSRVLGTWLPRHLGRISYGVYLFHWPIFLWFRSTGRTSPAWFVVATTITIAVAAASFAVVEFPVRTGAWPRGRARGVAVYATTVAVAGGLALMVVAPTSTISANDAQPSIVTFAPLPTRPDAASEPTTTPAPQPPTVLVLGTDRTLAARLQQNVGIGRATIIDRTSTDCPAFASTGFRDITDVEFINDCDHQEWTQLIAQIKPTAVVVGFGLMERLPFRLGSGEWVTAAVSDNQARTNGIAEIASYLDDLQPKVLAYDSMSGERDIVGQVIAAQVELHPDLTLLTESGIAAFADLVAPIAASAPPSSTALRVLVVGDSTAFAFAEGFASGSQGVLEIVSGGVIRCPLVRASFTLGGPGLESSTEQCLSFDTDWPRLIDQYDIDVVFALASLAEQWDQKYPDDDRWYAPGSERYNAFHDSEMDGMSAILAELDVPLFIADAPYLAPDLNGFYGREAARVDAWNAVIDRWDERWPNVIEVPFAQWFADPTSAESTRQRPDGVHVSTEFANEMTKEHLLGAFLAAYEQVRTDS